MLQAGITFHSCARQEAVVMWVVYVGGFFQLVNMVDASSHVLPVTVFRKFRLFECKFEIFYSNNKTFSNLQFFSFRSALWITSQTQF